MYRSACPTLSKKTRTPEILQSYLTNETIMTSKIIAASTPPIVSAVLFCLFISCLWYARLPIPLATANPSLM